MNVRRTLRAGAALAALLAQGCRNANTPPDQPAGSSNDPTHAHTTPAERPAIAERSKPEPPASPDEIHGTAEVLAQKSRSYVDSVSQVPARRAQGTAGNAENLDSPRRPDVATRPAVAAAPATNPAADPNSAEANIGEGAFGVPRSTAFVRPRLPTPQPDPSVEKPLPTPAEAMAQRLTQHAKDYPQDLAAQLDFQLLGFLNGESVPQLPAMAGLAAEDREVLSALIDGMSNFRNAVRADGNILLSRKIRPVLEMSDRLRNQAELTIPVIALCRRVDGFGVYEPIEGERFVAGKEQLVIVYCEVENFASQLSDRQRWETKLKQDIVLYTETSGLEVWRDKSAKPIVDLSRNRRHDFYVVKMIKLPASLTIGRYLLKVSIEDQQVSRIAENTAAIQIVAQ